MPDSHKSQSIPRTDRLYFKASDPTGGDIQVSLTHRRLHAEAKKGCWAIWEVKKLVPEILENPKAIFEGIRWDEDEDRTSDADGWRCYCGVPRASYDHDGHPHPPYPDEVYLVFVNAEGVVYNWRWEACDPDNTTVPQQHGSRFCKQVWP